MFLSHLKALCRDQTTPIQDDYETILYAQGSIQALSLIQCPFVRLIIWHALGGIDIVVGHYYGLFVVFVLTLIFLYTARPCSTC